MISFADGVMQTARRPVSYAGAADAGPCEGRQTSPSNPTGAAKARGRSPRNAIIMFRCTETEKAVLRARAETAGLSAAELLREALGLAQPRRRKPVPRLVLALGRIGGNLNQIARQLNVAALRQALGPTDALGVAAALVSIDRQLSAIRAEAMEKPGC